MYLFFSRRPKTTPLNAKFQKRLATIMPYLRSLSLLYTRPSPCFLLHRVLCTVLKCCYVHDNHSWDLYLFGPRRKCDFCSLYFVPLWFNHYNVIVELYTILLLFKRKDKDPEHPNVPLPIFLVLLHAVSWLSLYFWITILFKSKCKHNRITILFQTKRQGSQ